MKSQCELCGSKGGLFEAYMQSTGWITVCTKCWENHCKVRQMDGTRGE